MIDVMVAVPCKNWVVSVGRDKCIFVWKFINHHLVKYLEILDGSESSESDPSDSREELRKREKIEYEYLVRYESAHRDIIRSAVWMDQEINRMSLLMTASEDKTIKFHSLESAH